jgi:hypothetical protein
MEPVAEHQPQRAFFLRLRLIEVLPMKLLRQQIKIGYLICGHRHVIQRMVPIIETRGIVEGLRAVDLKLGKIC